ncbi:release factor glutamine methyltransferase [Arboricoccus pini]|uniref:Release factor glutamine methyltransferase n=1 Tax=Arboricoccus pini TaxID=1963835 RepID=A0A212R001_9PROT|nr:peptide chain release factor N(5)-glutamine methyltransferase [Arboricoccus pini]SNB65328.1 release factor glutamine methyltransferase [Arboricoccus pini]
MSGDSSVATLLDMGVAALKAAGVENPRAEARLLLAYATGLDKAAQIRDPQTKVTTPQQHRYDGLVSRRAAREPMAYILGHREFYGLEFDVNPAVLIPRPETELIVERGSQLLAGAHQARILDIATGSGCLLVALLTSLPGSSGQGSDVSAPALEIAKANARKHGVDAATEFFLADWAKGIEGPFDLIVSNPPYIPHAEIAHLQPEVALFEPLMALDGGTDGIEPYKAMTPDLMRLSGPTTRILLEIGQGQENVLDAWFAQHGFVVGMHRDHAGIVRVLELCWPVTFDRSLHP